MNKKRKWYTPVIERIRENELRESIVINACSKNHGTCINNISRIISIK